MLFDSNIIIYSIQPKHDFLVEFILKNNCVVSEVSIAEVLGFHKITSIEKLSLRQIFNEIKILDLNRIIIEAATVLRQQKSMSLGDSLIAGTALVHQIPLVTRNTDDFLHIEGLKIINPFEKSL